MPPRRRPRESDATAELRALAGSRAASAVAQHDAATGAFAAGRDREAVRALRPLAEQYPSAASVRELLGLALYRSGSYAAAEKELAAFHELTGSVDQHPPLMDCARAQRRYRRVEELWEDLRAASPSGGGGPPGRGRGGGGGGGRGGGGGGGEDLRAASPSAALVTEGRIVAAGALADRGRLGEAIALLERRAGDVRRVQEHHLRLWYALADLRERAGDLPAARALFARIRKHDPRFADVAERLAALG
jgi:tetratricopeptide (TPR) repeat protein